MVIVPRSLLNRSGAIFILFTLLLAFQAPALLAGDLTIAGEMSVHPKSITAQTRFLILIDQPASDFCTSDVQISIEPAQIDLWVVPMSGAACSISGSPARQTIFSPRDLVPESYTFEEQVKVRYRLISDNEVIDLDNQVIRFVQLRALPERVESGSWITPKLPQSSLQIDQQEDLISLSLLEYDMGGRPIWLYSAGRIDGDTYEGDLFAYRETMCRMKHCSRAGSQKKGRIRLILRDTNDLVVQYQTGINLSSRVDTEAGYAYQRIDLVRSPEAQKIDASGAQIPDLVGNWVGGIITDGGNADRPSSLEVLDVEYLGPSGVKNQEHIFLAFAGSGRRQISGGVFPKDQVRLAIVCTDHRPETQRTQCQVMDIAQQSASCAGEFPLASVGAERISAPARCSDAAGPYDTRFEMFRLDPDDSRTRAASSAADDAAQDTTELQPTSELASKPLLGEERLGCGQGNGRWSQSHRDLNACD